MLANYHTHTARCMHATGEDEEYVLAAIEAGYTTLGFSDHAPFYYPNDYVSFYKMTSDKLMGYADSVRSLTEKYKGKIDIHLGLEAEYFPELFDEGLKLWKRCGINYLILGQHFVGREYDETVHRAGWQSDEEILHRYINTCIAAIETGKFSYVAHPDMLNYVGSDSVYEREVLRLTECAMLHKTPLEVNLLGLYEGRTYPCERFWEIASRLKPEVIIGNDAHTPLSFARTSTREAAVELLRKYGLTPLERLSFKPI